MAWRPETHGSSCHGHNWTQVWRSITLATLVVTEADEISVGLHCTGVTSSGRYARCAKVIKCQESKKLVANSRILPAGLEYSTFPLQTADCLKELRNWSSKILTPLMRKISMAPIPTCSRLLQLFTAQPRLTGTAITG